MKINWKKWAVLSGINCVALTVAVWRYEAAAPACTAEQMHQQEVALDRFFAEKDHRGLVPYPPGSTDCRPPLPTWEETKEALPKEPPAVLVGFLVVFSLCLYLCDIFLHGFWLIGRLVFCMIRDSGAAYYKYSR